MPYLGTPSAVGFSRTTKDRFSGDNSTTGFTMSKAASTSTDIQVFVDNIRQEPTIAYSTSGATLTFTEAPPAGTNNVYVIHQHQALGAGPLPPQDLGTTDYIFGDDISFQSDSAKINFGLDSEVNLTHVHNTGLLLNSTNQLQFGDSGTHISQSADGVLDLVADSEIEINATTIDINGAVDISGNITLGGNIVSATTITTTGNEESLTLVSTDADSNSGPHLVLDRQSASPADSDFLGQVVFRGKNDAGENVDYATIRGFINDASDGTEDTDIDIISLTGGTSRNRFQIGATETIVNNNGVDIDFRVESDGNANMLIVDAGLDAVLIGTNAEYSGTGADLTVNKSMDVGDSSSSDSATFAFAKNGSTGTIGSLQSKIAGFGNMPKINFTATNVGGGSQAGELEFFTTTGASQALRFKIAANGDLTATDTSIGSISDKRLKKDVKDFTYDLEKFKTLETKSFKWKNPILHGNRSDTVYGTIAQQIESVDADFIIDDQLKETLDKDGIEYDNPDYLLTKDTNGVAKTSKITGKKDIMFISVIQQLISKIEILETEVKELKG